MNLQEFAKLKEGDAIFNGMTRSRGIVTSVDAGGVKVRWGDSGPEFAFSVNSTAWFHWELMPEVENEA